MTFIKKIRARSKRKSSPLLPLGFHGDKFLLRLVHEVMATTPVFIETGTNVGSTLTYVARTFPHVSCYSCEPDFYAYREAVENSRHLSGIHLYNETSQLFFQRLKSQHSHLFETSVLFWLDAHGYGFEWPLRDEIQFISENFSSALILIDDFKVPGSDQFEYDVYEGQECSLDYIKPALKPDINYKLFYPTYKIKTSSFHSLRGWGLLCFGQNQDNKFQETMGNEIREFKIEF